MSMTLAALAHLTGGRLVGRDAAWAGAGLDSRTVQHGQLFVALRGERVDGHDYLAAAAAAGAAGALVERPVDCSLPQVVVTSSERALQQAAAAHRARFRGPVIAVAGSNGKTTSKEMVRAILARSRPVLATRGNLNNHLGVPLTLLAIDETHAAAVIEVGANHPGEVAFLTSLVRPDVGLVTNAGAEHLEGFGDLEGVARAEGELFAGLGASAVAAINADDEFAALWSGLCGTPSRRYFGFAATADCRIGAWRAMAPGQVFELHTNVGSATVGLPLLGRHNALNAAGAAAAALAAGASLQDVVDGLAGVQPVAGRLVPRTTPGGALLIDDTYNANPSSVSAGLDLLAGYPGERWFVLGEMAELGAQTEAAHRAAGREARERGVTRLFTLGAPTRLAAAAFGPGAESHAEAASLAAALRSGLAAHSGGPLTLYVKGSRVNRLERVVETVLAPVGGGGANAA